MSPVAIAIDAINAAKNDSMFVKKYNVPKSEKANPFAITFSKLLIPPFSCAIPFFRFCLNLNFVQMNPMIKNSITKINPSIPVTRYIRFPINIELTVPLKSNIFNFSTIIDVSMIIVVNIRYCISSNIVIFN